MAQRSKTARTLSDGKRGSVNEAVIRLHREFQQNGRKMRPKCTMLQINLHISKKSTIFAAELFCRIIG